MRPLASEVASSLIDLLALVAGFDELRVTRQGRAFASRASSCTSRGIALGLSRASTWLDRVEWSITPGGECQFHLVYQ